MYMYLLPVTRKESIQNENSKIRNAQEDEADTMRDGIMYHCKYLC